MEINKLRVFTAFSGYDSQCMALDKLGIDYELVGWSEIDKYAIQAHNAVYPQWADRNYGDISKIDWAEVPDFDLFTMSSPCQDFSSAGMQRGGAEGSGTRSSLLWECRKAILAKKPKYIVFENVKALVSAKFLPYFKKWQSELQSYGYQNFAQVLNAKDYGVPQNRERIFMISILDREASYHFPEPFKLEKRLKDVLEQNVDEKYYLSDRTVQSFAEHCERKQAEGCGFKFEPTFGESYAKCISTNAGSPSNGQLYKGIMKEFLGYGRSRSSSGKGDVIKRHFNEYVNCLHTQDGTARENMEVLVAEFLEPIGCAMRGRNPENPSERGRSNGKYKQRIEMGSNISNTITSVQKDSLVAEPNVLTPKRTDFGKQVRKQYESGELDMSRHDMTELEPRTDGVSNTLTSVQKDNLLAEPIIIDDYNQRVPQDQDGIGTVTTQFGNSAPRHGYKIAEPLRIPQATKKGYIEVPPGSLFDMSYPESTTRRGRVQEGGKVSPTLMASGDAPCLFEGVSVHPNSHALEFKGEKASRKKCHRH